MSRLWKSTEDASDVLGGSPVLLRNGVGVVASHLHGRPAEARLLLSFRDDAVDLCGVEVTKRVQVDVLSEVIEAGLATTEMPVTVGAGSVTLIVADPTTFV